MRHVATATVLLLFACAQGSQTESGADAGGGGADGALPSLPDASATDGAADLCKVGTDDNAGMCTHSVPAGSFEPKLEWSYIAPPKQGPGFEGIQVIPLVGNFTDDNHDGRIDLCDTPDVIVVTSDELGTKGIGGKMRMLAGDTGVEEIVFDGLVDYSVTPAFGDLDGDGVPEIVTHDDLGRLVVYKADGSLALVGPVGAYASQVSSFCQAIAIYDLDGDGAPEIISAFEVFDRNGKRLFGHDESSFLGHYWCPANIAADLDGDGKLEVIFGNAAYHADGTLYWSIPGPPGQPQIANLDSDPDPEIFIAREDGIVVLEHDGKIKLGPTRLVDEQPNPNCWSKPGAIHDFDGDGIADISASTCDLYGVYGLSGSALSMRWSAPVLDNSGLSSTTAFDFLGSGVAQAVYTDEKALYVFDGKTGSVTFSEPRTSRTLIEYPIVADVNNDGSADILVVSNSGTSGFGPALQVFGDALSRWVPTRRVWNQHAYHVTNVREDGTIPAHPKKSWLELDTFRTNAQVQGNSACKPPPPN